MEGRGKLHPGPSGEQCQWKDKIHTVCVKLLDDQAYHCQDSPTGA